MSPITRVERAFNYFVPRRIQNLSPLTKKICALSAIALIGAICMYVKFFHNRSIKKIVDLPAPRTQPQPQPPLPDDKRTLPRVKSLENLHYASIEPHPQPELPDENGILVQVKSTMSQINSAWSTTKVPYLLSISNNRKMNPQVSEILEKMTSIFFNKKLLLEKIEGLDETSLRKNVVSAYDELCGPFMQGKNIALLMSLSHFENFPETAREFGFANNWNSVESIPGNHVRVFQGKNGIGVCLYQFFKRNPSKVETILVVRRFITITKSQLIEYTGQQVTANDMVFVIKSLEESKKFMSTAPVHRIQMKKSN